MIKYRIFIVFCICIFSVKLYGQNNKKNIGVVEYKLFIHFGKNPDPPINTTLSFNSKESAYMGTQKIQENINKNMNDDTAKVVINLLNSFDLYVFKDFESKKMNSIEYVLSKKFNVSDTLPNLKWEHGNNNKAIGKFNCQNAFTTFRGRKYEAWFCPDIPVPNGPWKLHGLPGLILEAKDTTGEIYFAFESINIPASNTTSMLLPDITKTINYAEYKRLWRQKLSDLSKQFQSSASSAQNGFDVSVNMSNFKSIEDIDK
jgi:GLPGLI family protein